MKEISKRFAWAICVFFVFSSLLLQSVSAKGNNSVSLFMEDGKKMFVPFLLQFQSPLLLVMVFLSIHSSTQRSDITICISKDGKALYEDMIPASKTDCVTIDLSDFEPGTYSVELKKSMGWLSLGKVLYSTMNIS